MAAPASPDSKYAFATLLTSDAYIPGALALAGALRDLHPSPAVAPEVEFQTEDDKGLKLLGRLDLNTVLTKLHVFRLTQYTKIIFLDADVLPVRPLSHLFTLPYEFSAVPDVGWPDAFNSGVMVLSPGNDKFDALNELLKTQGSWDGGDQGLLNEWRGNDWNRLSFVYNTTPTAAYTYAPAYERFGSQISAIHFIGPNKPWKSLPFRPPFQSQGSGSSSYANKDTGPLPSYDYNTLVDRWFAVYDKHVRAPASIDSPVDFEVKRYVSAWDGTSAEVAGTESALGLEDLRKMAIHGISAAPQIVQVQTTVGEGEYVRMPLEGRIDLMRPKKPEPEPKADEEIKAPSGGSSESTTPRPRSPMRLPIPPTPPSPHLAPILASADAVPSTLPPRPPSPPMMLWNPATEPPPTTQPPLSAFPTDMHFENIWDQKPQHQQHQGYRQGPRAPSPPPPSDTFFHAPPPTQIPEPLRRQGEYEQVTGPTLEQDRGKVKSIFPWEEKPRQMPGRVWPEEDKPEPSQFVSTAPSVPAASPVMEQVQRQPMLSPLPLGLPATLAYANAWDTVPSIQKYASRLARPPHPPASPFPEDPRRRWDDRTEASSMDGDDEDEGEEDDDDESRSGLSESDRETAATSTASRSSRISATYSFKSKVVPKEEYKQYTVRGVQTITPRYRSQGTQVNTAMTTHSATKVSSTSTGARDRHARRPSQSGSQDGSGKRQWTVGAATALPPVTTTTTPRPIETQQQQQTSPRALTTPITPAMSVQRTTSTTSSSSSTSVGPTSPPDTIGAAGARKGSRVWDPARGVELFKRGSEEVLARFLKMGSWEEEQGQQQ
ncbi:putative glycosyltransferase family 8 protein GLGEN [Mycena chlorophos]|uniref:glycogenin glucosyltransferase n=1 Tax=Mycena chlorophos TaxID=658473 RepID=A0A8H6T6W3_MYCCL|nr:putative glycosyltransferase family 8 protein GLGEN [Mycena chlorophos]